MQPPFSGTSRRDFLKVGAGLVSAPGAAYAAKRPLSPAGDVHVENVILIVTDSMRRDALSPYGSGWIPTPHFDALSRSAVVFDNAFLSSFPTVPCRNDILTGRYTFTYKDWSPLDQDAITLQETLGKAGILTSLVADTPHPFTPGYNYQRGFSAWDINRGQESDAFRSAPYTVKFPCNPKKLRDLQTVTQYLRNTSRRTREEDYFSPQTFTKAADWLQDNNGGPRFFLYVDTFDPHEPWDPPAYYVRKFDPDYTGEEVIYPRYDVWRDFLSEAELNHCRALYAGEVTMVDRWFGFLLDRITSLGLLKNTALIHIADHGFYLGEHSYIGKCIVRDNVLQYLPLYTEVCRIPMTVYVPGCQGGIRLTSLAQPVDIMPTVLDLLGVPKPASVEGTSLVPVLEGRTPNIKDIAVGSPALVDDRAPKTSPPPAANRSTITDGEWLFIYGAQVKTGPGGGSTVAVDSKMHAIEPAQGEIRPELYNIRTDPGCTHNVIGDKSAVAAGLQKEYVSFLRGKKYPEAVLRYFQGV